jgi:hypothetical protein
LVFVGLVNIPVGLGEFSEKFESQYAFLLATYSILIGIPISIFIFELRNGLSHHIGDSRALLRADEKEIEYNPPPMLQKVGIETNIQDVELCLEINADHSISREIDVFLGDEDKFQ